LSNSFGDEVDLLVNDVMEFLLESCDAESEICELRFHSNVLFENGRVNAPQVLESWVG
jgi:hypothetical protein